MKYVPTVPVSTRKPQKPQVSRGNMTFRFPLSLLYNVHTLPKVRNEIVVVMWKWVVVVGSVEGLKETLTNSSYLTSISKGQVSH
jgi:hypothetical protein